MSAVRRLCGECRQWQSRPCGDGCYLSTSDPTEDALFTSAGSTPSRTAEFLAYALAPLMPSETAAPHAALEWQMAREYWLRLLAERGESEAACRERSSIALAATRKEVLS